MEKGGGHWWSAASVAFAAAARATQGVSYRARQCAGKRLTRRAIARAVVTRPAPRCPRPRAPLSRPPRACPAAWETPTKWSRPPPRSGCRSECAWACPRQPPRRWRHPRRSLRGLSVALKLQSGGMPRGGGGSGAKARGVSHRSRVAAPRPPRLAAAAAPCCRRASRARPCRGRWALGGGKRGERGGRGAAGSSCGWGASSNRKKREA